jgi:iron complex outermembrane receptor protein
MAHLLTTFELSPSFDVRARLRWVDELPSQNIPSYAAFDTRLTWKPMSRLELGITGQNLFDPRHAEFGGNSANLTEVERSVFGEATWRW